MALDAVVLSPGGHCRSASGRLYTLVLISDFILGVIGGHQMVFARKREDSSLKDHSGYCVDHRTMREKELVESREQF